MISTAALSTSDSLVSCNTASKSAQGFFRLTFYIYKELRSGGCMACAGYLGNCVYLRHLGICIICIVRLSK